jgi:hypothetical protein
MTPREDAIRKATKKIDSGKFSRKRIATETPALDAMQATAKSMWARGCSRDEVCEFVFREIENVPREELIYSGLANELDKFLAEATIQLLPRGGGITVPCPEFLVYRCECGLRRGFIVQSIKAGEITEARGETCTKCGIVPKLRTTLTDRQRDALTFNQQVQEIQ